VGLEVCDVLSNINTLVGLLYVIEFYIPLYQLCYQSCMLLVAFVNYSIGELPKLCVKIRPDS